MTFKHSSIQAFKHSSIQAFKHSSIALSFVISSIIFTSFGCGSSYGTAAGGNLAVGTGGTAPITYTCPDANTLTSIYVAAQNGTPAFYRWIGYLKASDGSPGPYPIGGGATASPAPPTGPCVSAACSATTSMSTQLGYSCYYDNGLFLYSQGFIMGTCSIPTVSQQGAQQTCLGTFTQCAVACCSSGLSACSGSCVNVASDSNNCGFCGNVCGAGQQCISYSCQTI